VQSLASNLFYSRTDNKSSQFQQFALFDSRNIGRQTAQFGHKSVVALLIFNLQTTFEKHSFIRSKDMAYNVENVEMADKTLTMPTWGTAAAAAEVRRVRR